MDQNMLNIFVESMMNNMIDEVPKNPLQRVCKDMAKYMDPVVEPSHIEKNKSMRINSNTCWIKSIMETFCRDYPTKKERTAKLNAEVEFFCEFDDGKPEKMDRPKIKKWLNRIIKLLDERNKN